jgi:hypothetical protein
LATVGFEAIGSTPEIFTTHIAAESARWGRIVREGRIKVD